MRSAIGKWVTLGAGNMDALTGLGLLFAPRALLSMMGITLESDEGSMRLVGAFVFSVGTLYLLAWRLGLKRGDWSAVRGVWGVTAWIRACVGVSVTALVGLGEMETGWLTVGVVDLGLAAFQLAWLARGQISGYVQ